MVFRKVDTHMYTVKLDSYLTLYVNINPNWSEYLKVRCENVQLLEDNTEGKLLGIGLGKGFLGVTHKLR
jgi:hypothetical protein